MSAAYIVSLRGQCEAIAEAAIRDAVAAERALADRLAEALGKALETIYWMSGSTDFGPNGQAGQHWRDDALPANEKARAALAAHAEARGCGKSPCVGEPYCDPAAHAEARR